MKKAIKINDRNFIFDVNEELFDVKNNGLVIVSSKEGILYCGNIKEISPKQKYEEANFVRACTFQDINSNLKNIKDAKTAVIKCKDLIIKYTLDMNVVNAYYTFDRKQLLFFFTSDNRVDFRNLAKDLAAYFKARIELRQIGVRDKAKNVGGIGTCGRELCCNKFLNSMDSVSINMAKNQNLALNPSKINGVCGRLLCCLKYEDCQYCDFKKKLPSIGQIVTTDSGEGKVISIHPCEGTYKVDVTNVGIIEMKVE